MDCIYYVVAENRTRLSNFDFTSVQFIMSPTLSICSLPLSFLFSKLKEQF